MKNKQSLSIILPLVALLFSSCQKENNYMLRGKLETTNLISSRVIAPPPIVAVFEDAVQTWDRNNVNGSCPASGDLYYNSLFLNKFTGIAQESTPTGGLNNYVVVTGASVNYPRTFFKITKNTVSNPEFIVTAMCKNFKNTTVGDIYDIDLKPGTATEMYGIQCLNGVFKLVKINNWDTPGMLSASDIVPLTNDLRFIGGLNGNTNVGFGMCFQEVGSNYLYIYSKSTGRIGLFDISTTPATLINVSANSHFTVHAPNTQTSLCKSGSTMFIEDGNYFNPVTGKTCGIFNKGSYTSSVFNSYMSCKIEDMASFPTP